MVCNRMDDSCRPVRLRKVVLGYACSDNMSEFRFDLMLTYRLANVILTYSDLKPTLVVRQSKALYILHCVSKNVFTFKLAVTLSNLNRFFKVLYCWKAYEICYNP